MDLLCKSKVCRVDIWHLGSDLVHPCKHKPGTSQQTLESLQVNARVEMGLIKCNITCSSISRTIGLQRVYAEEFANEQYSSSSKVEKIVERILIA